MHVQVSMWAQFSINLSKWLLSMSAGLYAKDMFSLERNRWAITQSGCYDFATPPTITESSCGSISLTTFGIVSVLGLGHSNSKQWYLTDGLICNYLMTYDAEHLFICSLAIFFDAMFIQVICLF